MQPSTHVKKPNRHPKHRRAIRQNLPRIIDLGIPSQRLPKYRLQMTARHPQTHQHNHHKRAKTLRPNRLQPSLTNRRPHAQTIKHRYLNTRQKKKHPKTKQRFHTRKIGKANNINTDLHPKRRRTIHPTQPTGRIRRSGQSRYQRIKKRHNIPQNSQSAQKTANLKPPLPNHVRHTLGVI